MTMIKSSDSVQWVDPGCLSVRHQQQQ